MTVEEMIYILDVNFPNPVLDHKEGQQIIAALKAGQAMRDSVNRADTWMDIDVAAWDAALEEDV